MTLTMYKADFKRFVGMATEDNNVEVMKCADQLLRDNSANKGEIGFGSLDATFVELLKYIQKYNLSVRLTSDEKDDAAGVKEYTDLIDYEAYRPSKGNIKVCLDD